MKRKSTWSSTALQSVEVSLNQRLSSISPKKLPYVLAAFGLALSVAFGVMLFSSSVSYEEVGAVTTPGGLSRVTESLPDSDPWRAAGALYRAHGFLDSLDRLGPEEMQRIYLDKLNPQQ